MPLEDDDTLESRNDLALQPVILPYSGVKLVNRFVKAAMYEHLSHLFGGPPNELHQSLYSRWAQHDWAMIITGNVQVCPRHLTLGRDVVVPRTLTEENIAPFKALSAAMRDSVPIMQLSHAGRQSSNIIGGRLPFAAPSGPSAVRVQGRSEGLASMAFHHLLFQTPHSLTRTEISTIVDDFLRGADLAWKSGFKGVELHAAHGYLLSQFLSKKTNLRTDEYSYQSPENALRLLHRIVIGIRRSISSPFILGIKFSTDIASSDQETRALDYIRILASWGTVDFIEVSGGDYTDPAFMASSASSSPRQAIFAAFAEKASILLSSMNVSVPLIMLTGGLRSPALCQSALAKKQTDLLGIGRGAILCPELPAVYGQRTVPRAFDTEPFSKEPDDTGVGNRVLKLIPKISLIGAGTSMAWYVVMLRSMAATPNMAKVWRPSYGVAAILHMWCWLSAPELRFWPLWAACSLVIVSAVLLSFSCFIAAYSRVNTKALL